MLHFFLFVIASVSEAISFVIGHFRNYYSVWFITRTHGIASPAFGGLNDRRSKLGSMTFRMNIPEEEKFGSG
jgi:hypothetical protein